MHTNLPWLTMYEDLKTFASVLDQPSIRFVTPRNQPTHFFIVRMEHNAAVGFLSGEMIHGDAGFKPDPRWLAILGRLRLGGTQSLTTLTTLGDTMDILREPRKVMKSIARRFNHK